MSHLLEELPSNVAFGTQQLSNVYHIGCGAFGNVYAGTLGNPLLQRTFAVKHVSATEAEQEIYILRKLALQPFICKFYGYANYTYDTALLLLECPITLRQFLRTQRNTKRNNLWPQQNVRIFVAELVLAVEAMHKKSITHNDISSANVLIDRNGHAVLGDFGIARENWYNLRRDWQQLAGLYEEFAFTNSSYSLRQCLYKLATDPNNEPDNVKTLKQSPYFGNVDWRNILRRPHPGPMFDR